MRWAFVSARGGMVSAILRGSPPVNVHVHHTRDSEENGGARGLFDPPSRRDMTGVLPFSSTGPTCDHAAAAASFDTQQPNASAGLMAPPARTRMSPAEN